MLAFECFADTVGEVFRVVRRHLHESLRDIGCKPFNELSEERNPDNEHRDKEQQIGPVLPLQFAVFG